MFLTRPKTSQNLRPAKAPSGVLILTTSSGRPRTAPSPCRSPRILDRRREDATPNLIGLVVWCGLGPDESRTGRDVAGSGKGSQHRKVGAVRGAGDAGGAGCRVSPSDPGEQVVDVPVASMLGGHAEVADAGLVGAPRRDRETDDSVAHVGCETPLTDDLSGRSSRPRKYAGARGSELVAGIKPAGSCSCTFADEGLG